MARFAWFGLVGLVACSAPGVEPPPEVGEASPEIALRDSSGTEHRLSDQLGSPVVVDFSAMWCTRCKVATAELEAVHLARPEVVVWSVIFQNPDGDSPKASDLDNWSGTYGLSHTVLGDEEEVTWKSWGRGHQPVIFVIDTEGNVAWSDEASDQADIEAALDAL